MAIHELAAENLHYNWDSSITPQLAIAPGDTVILHLRDSSDGEAWTGFTSGRAVEGHPLTGPIYVESAQPGDTLEIEIVDMQVGPRGWTGFAAGQGLLGEDFQTNYLHFWDLSAHAAGATFLPGIRVPVAPFCGIMGVAWNEQGRFSTIPPRPHGGNMDIRQLTAGSKLQLPVSVAGGLFSAGDAHAAQGDGEVCITAIETDGRATLRFSVLKGVSIHEPRFWTPGTAPRELSDKGFFVTTAHAPDLRHASKQAIRYMIEYIVATYSLSAEDAYALCSVVVDLKISQIVDAPNWTVSAFLPLAIFA